MQENTPPTLQNQSPTVPVNSPVPARANEFKYPEQKKAPVQFNLTPPKIKPLILVLLIIIFLLGLAIVLWKFVFGENTDFLSKFRAAPSPTPTPTMVVVAPTAMPTSDIKIYKNEKWEFVLTMSDGWFYSDKLTQMNLEELDPRPTPKISKNDVSIFIEKDKEQKFIDAIKKSTGLGSGVNTIGVNGDVIFMSIGAPYNETFGEIKDEVRKESGREVFTRLATTAQQINSIDVKKAIETSNYEGEFQYAVAYFNLKEKGIVKFYMKYNSGNYQKTIFDQILSTFKFTEKQETFLIKSLAIAFEERTAQKYNTTPSKDFSDIPFYSPMMVVYTKNQKYWLDEFNGLSGKDVQGKISTQCGRIPCNLRGYLTNEFDEATKSGRLQKFVVTGLEK